MAAPSSQRSSCSRRRSGRRGGRVGRRRVRRGRVSRRGIGQGRIGGRGVGCGRTCGVGRGGVGRLGRRRRARAGDRPQHLAEGARGKQPHHKQGQQAQAELQPSRSFAAIPCPLAAVTAVLVLVPHSPYPLFRTDETQSTPSAPKLTLCPQQSGQVPDGQLSAAHPLKFLPTALQSYEPLRHAATRLLDSRTLDRERFATAPTIRRCSSLASRIVSRRGGVYWLKV